MKWSKREDVTKDNVSCEAKKILHSFRSVFISGNVLIDEEALLNACLYGFSVFLDLGGKVELFRLLNRHEFGYRT